MKTRLPENGASMSVEGGGGAPSSHRRDWGPGSLAPHGARWEGAAASGGWALRNLGDWRSACVSPTTPPPHHPPGQGGTWEGQPQAVGVPQARPRGAGNHFRLFGFKYTHCETTGPKPAFRGLPLPASGLGRQDLPHTSVLVIGGRETASFWSSISPK